MLSDRSHLMTTLFPKGLCMGTIVSFKYNYLLMISYDIYKNKCSRFISFFSLAIQYPDHKFSRSLYLLSILGFFPKFSFSNLSECLSKKKAALMILSGTFFADAREDFVFSKGELLYFVVYCILPYLFQRNHKMVLNTLCESVLWKLQLY